MTGMEEAGHKGWLTGALAVMATDNIVVEKTLYKGNSDCLKIFELVLGDSICWR